jgi:prepilin-type N-terminal cleavage/methylation domain-containing protein
MDLFKLSRIFRCHESGMTLLETVIALAILGTVAAAFLGGVATSSRGVYTADERATAESLARSQMEWAKNASYSYGATSYSVAPIPADKDYINYSANITAESLHDSDDGIQKITVTIMRSGESVFKLEGYKVDR